MTLIENHLMGAFFTSLSLLNSSNLTDPHDLFHLGKFVDSFKFGWISQLNMDSSSHVISFSPLIFMGIKYLHHQQCHKGDQNRSIKCTCCMKFMVSGTQVNNLWMFIGILMSINQPQLSCQCNIDWISTKITMTAHLVVEYVQ